MLAGKAALWAFYLIVLYFCCIAAYQIRIYAITNYGELAVGCANARKQALVAAVFDIGWRQDADSPLASLRATGHVRKAASGSNRAGSDLAGCSPSASRTARSRFHQPVTCPSRQGFRLYGIIARSSSSRPFSKFHPLNASPACPPPFPPPPTPSSSRPHPRV